MSTLFVNNLNTASGTTITVPTGKTIIGTDTGSIKAQGGVIQVVQGTTATRVYISTGTYTFTGLTASITPKFNNSKILVQVEQAGCLAVVGNTGDINMRLQRNSSDIYKIALGYYYGLTTQFRSGISGCFLDSPATTNATVYRTMFAANDGGSCAVQNDNANTVSTLTLMEIAQ